MSSEQYKRWWLHTTFTQSDIDAINSKRIEYALQTGFPYTPYIPMMCSEGPIVRPEEDLCISIRK